MTANPFRPAEQVAPKVKCLVYGPSGVGKTYLALTAPGPIAVIDTEGGTAFYANRVGKGGLSQFDVLPTKTFAQVEQAVAYLNANPGHYQTLVVDPVTVLYETLQDAAQTRRADQKHDPDADLEMLDWQRIKRAYKRLMTDLVNLPVHVIVTAREADLTEERRNERGRKERVKLGVRPDAEKSTAYYFDVVLRLQPAAKGREAVAEKDRTGVHALNARVVNPDFAALFDKAIAVAGDAERGLQSDAEAARIDADSTMAMEELRDREETLTLEGHVTRTGTVAKGEGYHSDLKARMQPTGYWFGWLLDQGDGKARPQTVVSDDLGAALYLAIGQDTDALLGQTVTVEGDIYSVTKPGRGKLYRLFVDRIATDEVIIPAVPDSEPDAAPEAESLPLPLDEAERELVGGGLPA